MPKLPKNTFYFVTFSLLILIGLVVLYFLYNNRDKTSSSNKAASDTALITEKPVMTLQSTCNHGDTQPTLIFSRTQANLEEGLIEYDTDTNFTTPQTEKFALGKAEVSKKLSDIGTESQNISARWRYKNSAGENWSEILTIRVDPC